MGDVSEMVLSGILCDLCGVYLGPNDKQYPHHCKSCEEATTPTTKTKKEISYAVPNSKIRAKRQRKNMES